MAPEALGRIRPDARRETRAEFGSFQHRRFVEEVLHESLEGCRCMPGVSPGKFGEKNTLTAYRFVL
jgi:hypothetical protein